MEIETQQLQLIVVGAHLRAEMADRPLADRLRDIILNWTEENLADDDDRPLTPVVCTDLWLLNNDELMTRPLISIGDPQVNAASAFLGSRLPTAFVIDDAFRVHADLEFIDLRVCMWGATTGATVSAIDLFAEKYLDAYLRSAHDMRPA